MKTELRRSSGGETDLTSVPCHCNTKGLTGVTFKLCTVGAALERGVKAHVCLELRLVVVPIMS